ncbi:MAG: acyl-CoA dehydrogenase family protein [Candidatus Helarchaeota archaeon]
MDVEPLYRTFSIFETEDERKFRNEVRKFVHSEILPEADIIEHEKLFPRHLFKKLGEKGYLRTLFPKSVGGTELGVTYGCILGEEISWATQALTAALDCSIFGSIPIMRYGSEELKQKYLPKVLSGDYIAAIAMTEPGAGSDIIGSMRTRAVESDDGEYFIINGEKRFITNGSQADFLVLWAITDEQESPHSRISAFVIEPGFEGFEVVCDFNLMGVWGLKNSYLRFRNMKVPKENLIGKRGMGAEILLDELDSERTLASAGACGIARRALEIAAKHANKRIQFGTPIRRFEAINFKIADMTIKLEAARNLVYQSAKTIDAGLNASKISGIAKIFATDVAYEITNEALQICGGLGYIKGEWNETQKKYLLPDGSNAYIVERLVRGSRLSKITAGTNEILRYLVQREVFREMNLRAPKESQNWGD